MPSSKEYLTTIMADAPAVTLCALASFPGGVCKAMKGDGRITNNEFETFVEAFDKQLLVENFAFSGIKYDVSIIEENSITGEGGNGGFFAAKTDTVVIIALFDGDDDERIHVQNAVQSMADYIANIEE